MRYEYHEDPGHGWIKVNIKELRALGIADKISQYSYRSSSFAYLEEDCDASTFIRAYEAQGIKFESVSVRHDNDAPIRNFPRYYN